MLVRLTRVQRLKAGWCAALVYLLCVLAPAVAVAMPGAHPEAPCLTGEGHMSRNVHPGEHGPAHAGDHSHHTDDSHAGHDHSSHDHGSHENAAKTATADDGCDRAAGKHASGVCCGLMCLSALPATLSDFAAPTLPTVLRLVEGSRGISDNTPAQLYRPPRS